MGATGQSKGKEHTPEFLSLENHDNHHTCLLEQEVKKRSLLFHAINSMPYASFLVRASRTAASK